MEIVKGICRKKIFFQIKQRSKNELVLMVYRILLNEDI